MITIFLPDSKESGIKPGTVHPPYSVGQTSGNDNNQNLKYPTLDAKIASTYAARSTAQNKNNLYDSYIRAIRWASDRIGDRGIVSFVSNGGFIESNTGDGLRKTFASEFNRIYVFNLRGNTRTSGEQARKEGGQTFGSGSRATVAIYLLIKNPDDPTLGKVFYSDIGDYLTREQKLETVRSAESYAGMSWTPITPNAQGDWVNQRNAAFELLAPLGDKARGATGTIFAKYSAGLQTNRDAWVYSPSAWALKSKVRQLIETYNSEVDRWVQSGRPVDIESFVLSDPARISWSRSLRQSLVREKEARFDVDSIRVSQYRLFEKRSVYFDKMLNHERSLLPQMFPDRSSPNTGFYIPGYGSGHPFSAFMVDVIPDVAFWGSAAGYFFPRYTYEERPGENSLFEALDGGDGPSRRIDNVTDEILADYQSNFGGEVTKDDIFYYVYGILHSPDYKRQFAADLKKMLPRIPKVKYFRTFCDAGRKLSELHLNYETVEPYPLNEQRTVTANHRVEKMRYAKIGRVADKSTVIYNSGITVSGIPEEAHEYMLGSRSAIDWIIERFQVRTDKASGIVNDPNDWAEEQGDPRYILDLLARIVTVSVETVKIVNSLPPLDIIEGER